MPPNPEYLLTLARKLGQSITGKAGFLDQAMKGLSDQPKLAQYLSEALGHATVPEHLSGIVEQPDLLHASLEPFLQNPALHPSKYGGVAKSAIQKFLKSIPTPQNPGKMQFAESSGGQIPEKYKALIAKATPGEQNIIQKILSGEKLPYGGVEHIFRKMRERMGHAPAGSASEAQVRNPLGLGGRAAAKLKQQPKIEGISPEPPSSTERIPFTLPKAQAKRKSGGRDLAESTLRMYRQLFPDVEPAPVPRRPPGELPPGQRSVGDLVNPVSIAGVKIPPKKPIKPKPEVEDVAVRRARALKKRKEMTK